MGHFSRAPVYFIVSIPPKMIEPIDSQKDRQNISQRGITYCAVDTTQVKTESPALSDTFSCKCINDCRITSELDPGSNSHEATRKVGSRSGNAKLLSWDGTAYHEI
jgi:hypothetical protein